MSAIDFRALRWVLVAGFGMTAGFRSARDPSDVLTGSSASSNGSYYVAIDGSDGNPGTIGAPFRTIQRCASVATAGMTCFIREGTYRETVTPAHSGAPGLPIIFAAYAGEAVNVSGADRVSNWVADKNGTYRADGVGRDLGFGNNQVLVDGTMIIEARWPNQVSGDLLRPTLARTQNAVTDFSTNTQTIYDSALDQPPGYWVGGMIWIKATNSYSLQAWVTQTARIVDSARGRVTFKTLPRNDHDIYRPGPGNDYYLMGKRAALDSPGEWFYENGALYLRTPGGDAPSAHVIEFKTRQYAFDLSYRDSIEVRGLQITASSVNMTESTNCELDGLRLRYISHFSEQNNPNIWVVGQNDTGIIISGSQNTVRNTEIEFSAGNGIRMLGGTNSQVINSIIHEVNYSGAGGNAITVSGDGHIIRNNTLYNAGRNIILHGGKHSGYLTRGRIEYNHMYNAGLLVTDNGVTYCHRTDGKGTVIAYNWIHGNQSPGVAPGIYLDDDSSNHVVHHNVVWNNHGAGIHINVDYLQNRPDQSSTLQQYLVWELLGWESEGNREIPLPGYRPPGGADLQQLDRWDAGRK